MALESCEVLTIDNKKYFFRLSSTEETDGNLVLAKVLIYPWYMPRGYDKDPKYYLMPTNLVKFNTEMENEE